MVRIAVDTQRELRSYPSWPSKKIVIKIRFGIHQGSPEIVFDKVAKGYDYFGDDVNKAARIEGLCNGRQILISDSSLGDTEVLVGLEKELNIRLGSSSPHILKGIDVPVELREIFFDSELNSSSGFFGQDSRSLDCELPRPTFLRVASDQCTATGEEENPMQRLYMTIMDGFFTTAVSHNETDNRFNWMARLLTTKLDANNDEEKLRLLTHRLGCLADQEAVKRACRQVVESDRAAALSAEEDDGDFTGSSAWDDKDFTQEASRT